VIHVPVTFETYGSSGFAKVNRETANAKSSSTGSMSGEWNACEVRRRVEPIPLEASCCSKRSMASKVPAYTVASGPLSTARDTPSTAQALATAAEAFTAVIAPAGAACMSRPRVATISHACSSDMTPARQAATYSPTLWPISESGRTPHELQSCATAYSTAKSAGCAISVRSMRPLPSASEKTTCRRSTPVTRRRVRAHASNAALNAGSRS